MRVLRRFVYVVATVAFVTFVAYGASDPLQKLLKLERAGARGQAPPARSVPELLSAHSVSSAEMASVAKLLGAPEYWLLPAGLRIVEAEPGALVVLGVGHLGDGNELSLGDTAEVGASVERGLLFHRGWQPVLVAPPNAEAGQWIQIKPRSLIAVGNFVYDAEAAAAYPKACSISCGLGYYACCNCTDAGARCKCVLIGLIEDCEGGGDGSISCSITCEITPTPG